MTDDETGVPDERYLKALVRPSGSYATDRAAQLAGIPRRSLTRWARNHWLNPDWQSRELPWSYRDLVFTRLLAFLLLGGMATKRATYHVNRLRKALTHAPGTHRITADRVMVLIDDEWHDPLTGQGAFVELRTALGVFDPATLQRVDVVEKDPAFAKLESGSFSGWREWKGPDLRTPSPHSFINPWVMSGDPCVERSRIPTSSIYGLHTVRGLTTEDIVEFYPDLTSEQVEDAIQLEESLRSRDSLAA